LLHGKASLKKDETAAAENADAIILVTEWPEFRLPDWDSIIKKMKGRVMFDGRNIYNNEEMKRLGFIYHGIGRETKD
jgi:UDPglucose 6-dehydrogenase